MVLFLVNHPYLINLALIIVLAMCLLKTKTMLGHFIILFWYSTLHYAYGWLPAFITSGYSKSSVLLSLTLAPQPQIKLLGFIFLLFFFSVFLFKHRELFNKKEVINYLLAKSTLIILLLGFSWCLYSFYYFYTAPSQSTFSKHMPIYILYFLAFMLISMLFAFCFKKQMLTQKERIKLAKHISLASSGIVLIYFAVLLFAEHNFYPRLYASLLNPNMFAFYCGLFLMIIYALVLNDKFNQYHIIGLIACSIGLFYSGSRSFLLVFTVANIVFLLLLIRFSSLKEIKYFLICAVISCSMLVFLLFFSFFIPQSSKLLSNIQYVTQYNSVRYLSGVVTMNSSLKDANLINHLSIVSKLFNQRDANLMSIEGRFSTKALDNNYIIIQTFLGWVSLFLWIAYLSLYLFSSCINLYKQKTSYRIFNLTLLIYMLLSASVMNIFFLFPSLLYLAIVFALQLA